MIFLNAILINAKQKFVINLLKNNKLHKIYQYKYIKINIDNKKV